MRCNLLLFTILLATLMSCSSVRKVSSFDNLVKGGTYKISADIDLHGKTIFLPDSVTLKFRNHIIKNGTLVGLNTYIKYKRICFANVKIKGSWIVPKIKSSMFAGIENNGLFEMMNLQNRNVFNDITIEAGEYHVNTNNERAAILLKSNVALHVKGHIILESQTNDKFYNGYYLISVNGAEMVRIDGDGVLEGDQGRSGIKAGYGHGICVFNSKGVDISGITIKNVNGDGIAISLGSDHVSVHDLDIDNYYRNGISIVDGKVIHLDRINIRNGGKSSPFAAIDVEPNDGYTVENVFVSNTNVSNCAVGLSGCAGAKAPVKRVEYNNIVLQDLQQEGIIASCFDTLVLRKVIIRHSPNILYVLKLLDCTVVYADQFEAEMKDNQSKYPFYVSSGQFTVTNSFFECPQLFSWHLSNASFTDTRFIFDSFVWTAAGLASQNLFFDNCDFSGPLFMRPSNVIIKNSHFDNGTASSSVPVVFEEKRGTDNNSVGVVFDNNTIRGRQSDQLGIQSSVRNSIISGNRSISGGTVRYSISGINVREFNNE